MRFSHTLYGGVKDIWEITHQSRYCGVWTYGITFTTSRTVLRNPLGVFKSNASHISENWAHSGHKTQTNERISDVVISHTLLIKRTCLFPKTVNVAEFWFTYWCGSQHRRNWNFSFDDLLFFFGVEYFFVFDFNNFGKSTLYNPHIVFYHTLTFTTKLMLQLVFYSLE